MGCFYSFIAINSSRNMQKIIRKMPQMARFFSRLKIFIHSFLA